MIFLGVLSLTTGILSAAGDGAVKLNSEAREAEAKQLLQQAASEETDCAKGKVYLQVTQDYSGTKAEKFAKKWLASFRAADAISSKKLRELVVRNKVSEKDLTSAIEALRESISICPAAKDRAEADIEFISKYREKKYGY